MRLASVNNTKFVKISKIINFSLSLKRLEIEINGRTLWITCIVNDSTIIFLNLKKPNFLESFEKYNFFSKFIFVLNKNVCCRNGKTQIKAGVDQQIIQFKLLSECVVSKLKWNILGDLQFFFIYIIIIYCIIIGINRMNLESEIK